MLHSGIRIRGQKEARNGGIYTLLPSEIGFIQNKYSRRELKANHPSPVDRAGNLMLSDSKLEKLSAITFIDVSFVLERNYPELVFY